MATNPALLKRITARPDVFGGKPIIRDYADLGGAHPELAGTGSSHG